MLRPSRSSAIVRIAVETIVWSSAARNMPDISPARIDDDLPVGEGRRCVLRDRAGASAGGRCGGHAISRSGVRGSGSRSGVSACGRSRLRCRRTRDRRDQVGAEGVEIVVEAAHQRDELTEVVRRPAASASPMTASAGGGRSRARPARPRRTRRGARRDRRRGRDGARRSRRGRAAPTCRLTVEGSSMHVSASSPWRRGPPLTRVIRRPKAAASSPSGTRRGHAGLEDVQQPGMPGDLVVELGRQGAGRGPRGCHGHGPPPRVGLCVVQVDVSHNCLHLATYFRVATPT